MKKRFLLLSPYDAQSHRDWHQHLIKGLPDYDWTLLTLAPRYFQWRIRGNALSYLDEPLMHADYDLLLVTSMADLASIKALFPNLAKLPSCLYCHENQFEFPTAQGQSARLEPMMVNLYAAACADAVVFNSDFNQRSFLAGATELLARMPDCQPRQLVDNIAAKSQVLGVGINQALLSVEAGANETLRIVWAARWEFDKGPQQLFEIFEALEQSPINYEFAILGQGFRQAPAIFAQIKQQFGHRISHYGFVEDKAEYYQILAQADIVLSTAIHEFQGLAVLESIAHGAFPILPNALCYPDMYPAAGLWQNVDHCVEMIVAYAQHPEDYQQAKQDCVERASAYCWPRLLPQYHKLFEQLLS